MLSKRETIANRMEDILDTFSLPLGIDVTRIDITDVVIPTDMQRAIAREAEAQRERKARLRRAEGEVEAVKNLAYAANTMAQNPELLELRRLQTVGELGMEQHTLITLVLPYDYGKLGGVGKGMKGFTVEDNEAFLASLKTINADDLLNAEGDFHAVIESEGEEDEDESPPVVDEAPALESDNLPAAPDFGDME
jgi:hypothetical protein